MAECCMKSVVGGLDGSSRLWVSGKRPFKLRRKSHGKASAVLILFVIYRGCVRGAMTLITDVCYISCNVSCASFLPLQNWLRNLSLFLITEIAQPFFYNVLGPFVMCVGPSYPQKLPASLVPVCICTTKSRRCANGTVQGRCQRGPVHSN
jgi:hypothetical protein